MTRAHSEPISRHVIRQLKGIVDAQPALFFRTPPCQARAMPAISAEVDLLSVYARVRDDRLDPRAEEVWTFDVPLGVIGEAPATRRAFIMKKHQAVWVNVGDLESGLGGGLIYQIAGAYARNNGWVLIGDPDGITEAGKRRRLENMIALALKYGSTEFIRPHDDMLGWNGLLWGRDDDSNLYALLRASRTLVTHFYPEMNDACYDFDNGRFLLAGVDLEPAAFPRLAAQKRAAWGADAVGAPGGGTLRLSILFQSLVEATADRGRPAGGPGGDLRGPDSVGTGDGFALCRY